jgi:hypothetical protein
VVNELRFPLEDLETELTEEDLNSKQRAVDKKTDATSKASKLLRSRTDSTTPSFQYSFGSGLKYHVSIR